MMYISLCRRDQFFAQAALPALRRGYGQGQHQHQGTESYPVDVASQNVGEDVGPVKGMKQRHEDDEVHDDKREAVKAQRAADADDG